MSTGGANSSNSHSTDKIPQIPTVENVVVGNPQVIAPEVEDPNGALADLTQYAKENNKQQSAQTVEQVKPQENPAIIAPITQTPENNPPEVLQSDPTIINTTPKQGTPTQVINLPNQENSMPAQSFPQEGGQSNPSEVAQKENIVLPETNGASSVENPLRKVESQVPAQPITTVSNPETPINPTENIPPATNLNQTNQTANNPTDQSATEPIDHKTNILSAIGGADKVTPEMKDIPFSLGFTTE